jgi:hypothetical protein
MSSYLYFLLDLDFLNVCRGSAGGKEIILGGSQM